MQEGQSSGIDVGETSQAFIGRNNADKTDELQRTHRPKQGAVWSTYKCLQ